MDGQHRRVSNRDQGLAIRRATNNDWTSGTHSMTYTWAGDGRRLSGIRGGATTSFVWDQAFGLPQLALERDGSGGPPRSYRYGLDLLSRTAGTSTARYHQTVWAASVT